MEEKNKMRETEEERERNRTRKKTRKKESKAEKERNNISTAESNCLILQAGPQEKHQTPYNNHRQQACCLVTMDATDQV